MQLNHFLSMFLAMTFLVINNANAHVTYDKNLHPTPPGSQNRTNSDDVHDFFVVGNATSVEFHTIKNPEGQKSNATCAMIIPNSDGLGRHGGPLYTGPCEVNAQNQTQVLVGQCIDPMDPHKKMSGNATITWYPTNDQDDQHKAAVHVETKGNIWVGTTKDAPNTPLMQGPFTLGGLQKQAILVNCMNSTRPPTANQTSTDSGSM